MSTSPSHQGPGVLEDLRFKLAQVATKLTLAQANRFANILKLAPSVTIEGGMTIINNIYMSDLHQVRAKLEELLKHLLSDNPALYSELHGYLFGQVDIRVPIYSNKPKIENILRCGLGMNRDQMNAFAYITCMPKNIIFIVDFAVIQYAAHSGQMRFMDSQVERSGEMPEISMLVKFVTHCMPQSQWISIFEKIGYSQSLPTANTANNVEDDLSKSVKKCAMPPLKPKKTLEQLITTIFDAIKTKKELLQTIRILLNTGVEINFTPTVMCNWVIEKKEDWDFLYIISDLLLDYKDLIDLGNELREFLIDMGFKEPKKIKSSNNNITTDKERDLQNVKAMNDIQKIPDIPVDTTVSTALRTFLYTFIASQLTVLEAKEIAVHMCIYVEITSAQNLLDYLIYNQLISDRNCEGFITALGQLPRISLVEKFRKFLVNPSIINETTNMDIETFVQTRQYNPQAEIHLEYKKNAAFKQELFAALYQHLDIGALNNLYSYLDVPHQGREANLTDLLDYLLQRQKISIKNVAILSTALCNVSHNMLADKVIDIARDCNKEVKGFQSNSLHNLGRDYLVDDRGYPKENMDYNEGYIDTKCSPEFKNFLFQEVVQHMDISLTKSMAFLLNIPKSIKIKEGIDLIKYLVENRNLSEVSGISEFCDGLNRCHNNRLAGIIMTFIQTNLKKRQRPVQIKSNHGQYEQTHDRHIQKQNSNVQVEKPQQEKKLEIAPQVEVQNNVLECPVCLENKISIVNPSCGHCFCEDCISHCDICPLCRKPVLNITKIFIG